MFTLSVLLVATSLKGAAGGTGVDWRETGRVAASWAGLALCVGLLNVLGFLLAFGLFTFCLVAVMYRRPLGVALAVALCMPAGFYLLFPFALNVALPVGKLGF